MSKTIGRSSGPPRRTGGESEVWNLRLYVAGQSPKCVAALNNLRALCEEHLPGRYRIEIIDLLEKPQLARTDEVVAIPTVVRKLPPPVKRLIGALGDRQRALVGLEIGGEP
ncbi:MAG TPA: circadian clock KaiB family protein [Candidatus Binatia bacterium]|nr:circadian clock KaiB family protein [Candidatus Binatia bacterium]